MDDETSRQPEFIKAVKGRLPESVKKELQEMMMVQRCHVSVVVEVSRRMKVRCMFS